MREFGSEGSEDMSDVTWASKVLREHAPEGKWQVKVSALARRLKWGFSRTKDVYFADGKIVLRSHEHRAVRRLAGLEDARDELTENERLIARARSILDSNGTGGDRASAAALRAFLGSFDRP